MLSNSIMSDSFVTPWTVAHQASLSMGVSRQEYWRTDCNRFGGFYIYIKGFLGGAVLKNPPASAGDIRYVGLFPGLGRSPGGGNGN